MKAIIEGVTNHGNYVSIHITWEPFTGKYFTYFSI